MKLRRINAIFNLGAIVLLLSIIGLSSCARKDSPDIEGPNTLIIQSVKVQEVDDPILINDYDSVVPDYKVASTKNIHPLISENLEISERPKGDMIETPSFDAQTEVEGHPIEGLSAKIDKKLALKKNQNKVAVDLTIGSSVKFRLIIYQASNMSTPIFNQVLGLGDKPSIGLNSGVEYKWFAFSINAGTVPNINSSGVVSKADIANKDFMFATNTLTPVAGENYLQITFKRQTALIQVDLNSRGIFGPMQDITNISLGTGNAGNSTFNNIIQTGDFNIQSGAYTNLTTENITMSTPAMAVVDTRWGNAQKLASFYSAENNTPRTISANQLKVRFNKLSITLDDGNTRTFTDATQVPIPHSTSLQLQKGKRSKATVRLVESGILVGGLYWARTNLIYDAAKLYGASGPVTGQSDAYRFRPNNNYITPSNNEYWNHNTLTPTGTDYSSTRVCDRVFPDGTWTHPIENQVSGIRHFTNLIAVSHNTQKLDIGGGQYRFSIVWARDASQPANPAYPDNDLILPFYGYRNSSGIIVQKPTGASNSSGQLHYWSMTIRRDDDDKGVLLYGTATDGTISNTLYVHRLDYREGRNIRCIRNQINN